MVGDNDFKFMQHVFERASCDEILYEVGFCLL